MPPIARHVICTAAIGLLLLASPRAEARTDCAGAARPTYEGSHQTEHVTVVRGRWCVRTHVVEGAFYRAAEIIRQPSMFQIKTIKYAFGFKSDRIGEDEFTVRVHWLSRIGRPVSALITVRVKVVATEAEVR